MIVHMGAEHVDEVARLHCDSLKGLLTALGPRAARAYYAGTVQTAAAVGLVFLEGSRVRGFVLGAADPGAMKRDVVRANPLGIAAALSAAVLTRPTSIGWLLRSFRGPDEGRFDKGAAELIYLAVDPQQRSGGRGRQLVDAFRSALAALQVPAFELSVDEDNRAAISFYEKLGFVVVGRYREFGMWHRRYRLAVGVSTY
jgi:ribosomal protein S18 acetylase RimI-like enzyme